MGRYERANHVQDRYGAASSPPIAGPQAGLPSGAGLASFAHDRQTAGTVLLLETFRGTWQTWAEMCLDQGHHLVQ